MCEKCVFNVGFCSVDGRIYGSVMDSPTLQDFPHRPIDWPASAHTHQKSLFIFSQCTHTHTHPHCPVPTSLDSVMTTIQQSMMHRQMGTMASGFNISEKVHKHPQ